MKYLLAVIFPPLAVFSCGKPWQGILNIILFICTVWIGSMIHAIFVVHNYYADERTQKLIQAIQMNQMKGA